MLNPRPQTGRREWIRRVRYEKEVVMNEMLDSTEGGPKRLWRLVSLAAILTLALVGMGTSAVSAAKPAVPLTFSVSGTFSPIDATHLSLAGTGIASQLGNVKSYQASVTLLTGVVGVTDVTDTLTETLTAANGDTITLSCAQSATLSSGVYHGTDTWSVISGTGRFSGATGSGTGNTTVDLSNHTFTKQGTGSITH